ncbi:hypothetical protein OFN42_37655, partial [Escherichia coli]|nr:hypothetical protein [Escherichia coli]
RILFYTLIQKICDVVLEGASKTLAECLKNNMNPLLCVTPDWGLLWKSCAFSRHISMYSAGWFMGKFAQSINDTGRIEWLWFFIAL